MENKTCCFTGHRFIAKSEYPIIYYKLKRVIERLIDKGVIYFYAGGALGFDTIAAEIILYLKTQYPQIKLIMVYPCRDQTVLWMQKDIEKYIKIKSRCDEYVYISEKYTNECMRERNRYLVDKSSYCIYYLENKNSGTSYTVNYALKKGLTVINIANKKTCP